MFENLVSADRALARHRDGPFLRHAASTGACSAALAGSIQGSRRYALESLPYALSWDDVRRVIATAIGLTAADVDLAERVLTIRSTKFYKTRLVPIGPQLAAALATYYDQRSTLPMPKGQDSAFLCSRSGCRLTYQHVVTLFQRIRSAAGITCPPGEPRPPRLHDLRHTAAVHRVLAWYRLGKDVQQLLPHLATYLGHTSIASTQRYLQMTPELLQEASRRFAAYAQHEAEQEVDHA